VLVQQGYRDQYRYPSNRMTVGEPLKLRQYPLAVDETGYPLADIVQDGVAIDPASVEADIDRGWLYSVDSTGACGWTGLLITVDYTAGYDPIPDDVQAATLEWITARWSAQGKDPALRSETIPDVISQMWSGDAQTPSMPSGVRELLAPYRLISL
jgi:hypothetical protein